MASEAARLVDELTTLLYEPCLGTCLTHGPDCLIVACGACRRKADKPESVVHDSDCPVYRLILAEAANTAVIRANADEIADLEDTVGALRARAERAESALADLRQSVFEWARVYGYPILAMTSEPMTRAAALAGSREQAAATTTTRTITMRCHCGRGVTIGPDPWCEGCVQSAATCDCVPVVIGEGA